MWIGLIWLRIGTSGGLLWTRWWTFEFHKMLRISWMAAQLAASQKGLSSMSEWGSEYWGQWIRSMQLLRNTYIWCLLYYITQILTHPLVFRDHSYNRPLMDRTVGGLGEVSLYFSTFLLLYFKYRSGFHATRHGSYDRATSVKPLHTRKCVHTRIYSLESW
jgi:hypothetical protein